MPAATAEGWNRPLVEPPGDLTTAAVVAEFLENLTNDHCLIGGNASPAGLAIVDVSIAAAV